MYEVNPSGAITVNTLYINDLLRVNLFVHFLRKNMISSKKPKSQNKIVYKEKVKAWKVSKRNEKNEVALVGVGVGVAWVTFRN